MSSEDWDETDESSTDGDDDDEEDEDDSEEDDSSASESGEEEADEPRSRQKRQARRNERPAVSRQPPKKSVSAADSPGSARKRLRADDPLIGVPDRSPRQIVKCDDAASVRALSQPHCLLVVSADIEMTSAFIHPWCHGHFLAARKSLATSGDF
jgi:hypothetical protein